MVLVDLPGVQRPRDALTARMARRVQQELEDSDAALLVLNGEQGVGPGDRFIARTLAGGAPPVTIARQQDRPALAEPRRSGRFSKRPSWRSEEEVFPISARTGTGVEALVEQLAGAMPEGPFMFGEGAISDQPLAVMLAELVREAVIRRTFQEVPHAVEVVVEEVEGPAAGLVRVRALIWVESALPEGNSGRCGRPYGQGGRDGRAARAGARAGLSGASRPVRARSSRLARRRELARPSGDNLGSHARASIRGCEHPLTWLIHKKFQSI